MADVDIDLRRLQATAGDAQRLRDAFGEADRFADDIGTHTGHDGLGSKVGEFGHEWDVAREELGEGLGLVADFMQAIHDTFTDLDEAMADGVTVEPR